MDIFNSDVRVKDLKRNLLLRFTILLAIFLLLLLISYAMAQKTIVSKKYDGLLINTAARQRMLIRKYTSEINQSLIGLATSDFKLALEQKRMADLSARLFEKTIKSYHDGGEILVSSGLIRDNVEHKNITIIYDTIVIPPVNNEEILLHLRHAKEQWNELKRIALLSLRSDRYSIAKTPYLPQLFIQTDIAVSHMDHVVQLMQSDSEKKLSKLDQLLFFMIVAGSVLFVLLIYYVNSSIVKPLGEAIQTLRHTTKILEIEKERAEQANRIKSDFLSSMSHELRTPMNAILGFSQMIQLDNGNLTKIQVENINEILMAGNHLMSLINEVLDLEKIESGKIDINFEVINLDDLIPECLSIIKPQAEEKHIEIIDEISNKGFIIQADRRRLKQVVINLLSNAVKYNRENGRVTIDSELMDKDTLRIKFTDTGIGIEQENYERIFSPFDRLHMKSNVEGTGIGLAVTKNLVELMCGSIGVESEVNKGSTFWIEFSLEGRAA